MVLSGGRKDFRIGLAVLIQYRSVSDTQPPSHPATQPRCRSYYALCCRAERKKRSEATQTLRSGCCNAEPKIFAPPQTPFPGARDGQNLISWRWSLPSPTNPVWWRSMYAVSSYSDNRPTNKHANRQGRLQCTAPQLSAQCN